MTNSCDTFYADLPAFNAFEQCADPLQYYDVPDDWSVLISDIKGSTKAISEGRYRDVNAIGVACIVAMINTVKPHIFPFVFGGDGATFALPSSHLLQVLAALKSCAKMASDSFDLELRVGAVPVRFLRQHGKRVMLAKYAANQHYQQAMFAGDGWSHADILIKNDVQFQCTEIAAANNVDYSGFECRWNEIRSPKGETVSLLVAALSSDEHLKQKIYADVLQSIHAIYGSDAQHHPVPIDQLKLSFSWRKLSIEARIRKAMELVQSRRSYQRMLIFLALAGKFLMARKISTESTQWGEYKERLRANTDYRKFDDRLRMVIAGTAQQREKLSYFLSTLHEQGKIAFGLHRSEAALITCVVNDYNHRHWHFLDGSDGGYTMAAVQLKQQLAKLQ